METLTEKTSPLLGKTKELCEALTAQPGFEQLIADLEAFDASAEAQRVYNDVLSLQEQLQAKQAQGEALMNEDIREFEEQRAKLFDHPIAGKYLEAQRQIQDVQQTVLSYLTKTFELGRVPLEEDLASGCCGGGCGGGSCGSCG